MKTLVLYVFHDYIKRVNSFINKALFQDENVDFIFICNNKNIDFVVPAYVKVLKRDNIGFDFGGWSDGLLTNDLYKNYDNFIFANSSIIGPFMNPNYKERWTNIYLNRLTNEIKLFGSTINTINQPLTQSHVQSFIFAMNKETLEFLIKKQIFTMSAYCNTIQDAVFTKEILMSRYILENGWNIGCLHKYYDGVDFRFRKKKPQQYRKPFLDNMMQKHYENKLWIKEGLVFIKGHLYGI
jgi:lipopolysaccharide biosynthesis protein